MPRAFVVAWLLGAGSLMLGEWWDPARIALLPAGAVVAAGGVALTRRTTSPSGLVESFVLRVAPARTAGLLILVLGVAWVATGAIEALAG